MSVAGLLKRIRLVKTWSNINEQEHFSSNYCDFFDTRCAERAHTADIFLKLKTNYFKLSVALDYGLYMTGNGGPADAGIYIETARIEIFRSHKRK